MRVRHVLHILWPIRTTNRHGHSLPKSAAFRRHHARRTVFAGLAWVLLAHVGLNVALDTVKPQWRDPEYGWRAKRLSELDRVRGSRPLVVVLGSSRTQMGLSPTDLGLGEGPTAPLVYNMGQAGAGPLLQLLNLKRLLATGVRPKTVLVEVMPPALCQDGPAEHALYPHISRLGAADIVWMTPYCDNPHSLWRNWAKIRVSPWFSLRFLLLSHSLPGFLPWQQRVDFQWRMLDPYGWLPYPFEPIPDDTRARGTAAARESYQKMLATFRIAPLPDRALRDLIRLCRVEGIRVGLYLLPEGPVFRSWYPPTAQQTVTCYLNGLSEEYRIPLFDATDWLPDEDAFADSHHLLRSGARAFSRRFGRDSLGPWMESGQVK
jgi:hypothetical protein